MKTIRIHLWLPATAALLLLIVSVSSAASAGQAPSGAAKKLVGTWKLVSIEERDGSGKLVVPLDFGSEPVGMLTYDATGHMAAQAGRRGRPRLETEDIHRAPAEQAKAAFTGYAAYFGTYEVNERESIVTHHVEGSMLPNWEGGDQRRKFTLSGDKLILEPPAFQAKGEKRSRRLTWQRVH
ncbi:MAG: lipocalin-like domain-containing protein [Verrucomicrobia bacterium]|nr:lipocalin-like domain-containing protein [Verrucomicrobiota bacterium]